MKKRRNTPEKLRIRVNISSQGKIVNLLSRPSTHDKDIGDIVVGFKLLLDQLPSLLPHYSQLLEELRIDIIGCKISWLEVADYLEIPRSTFYRKLRNREFNIVEIQMMKDFYDMKSNPALKKDKEFLMNVALMATLRDILFGKSKKTYDSIIHRK